MRKTYFLSLLLLLLASQQIHAQLVISLGSSSNVQCNGAATGTATITVVGALGLCSYTWVPAPGGGQGTATATGMIAGTYTCNVRDSIFGTGSQVVTITQPPALTATAVVYKVSCFGAATGSVTLSASGGVPAYTYSWTPAPGSGAGTSAISSLTAGNYTCLIKDSHGCTHSTLATVTQNPKIILTPSVVNASCYATCNGSISTTVSGGVPGYTYGWTPNQVYTPGITSLCAGTYTCQVYDSIGCTTTATATVARPAPLVNTLAATNASCGMPCGGNLTSTATGGVTPYAYHWIPAGTLAAVDTALCAGTYSCILADAHGCKDTTAGTITAPPSPVITGLVSDTTGPINSGMAYLLLYDSVPKHQHVIDSVAIISGRYTFNTSVGGKFLVYAVANAASYPNVVKTYSPRDDQWKLATIVSAPCGTLDTANIHMFKLVQATGFGATFSGTVTQGSGYVFRLIPGIPSVQSPGDPVPGLDVNLEQHPGGIIATTTTDAVQGAYQFNNVPPGTYSVYVDIPGLGMVSEYTRSVVSTETFTNLNYVADSVKIYKDSTLAAGILNQGATLSPNLALAPNPFKDLLSVSYTLQTEGDVVFQINNLLGERIAGITRTHQDAGAYTLLLNTGEYNLSQGVYLFQMTSGSNTITRKIVSIK